MWFQQVTLKGRTPSCVTRHCPLSTFGSLTREHRRVPPVHNGVRPQYWSWIYLHYSKSPTQGTSMDTAHIYEVYTSVFSPYSLLIVVKIIPLCCCIWRNTSQFFAWSITIYLLYIKKCYMFRSCLWAVVRQYNTYKRQYVHRKILLFASWQINMNNILPFDSRLVCYGFYLLQNRKGNYSLCKFAC